jgi:hypothetical protein
VFRKILRISANYVLERTNLRIFVKETLCIFREVKIESIIIIYKNVTLLKKCIFSICESKQEIYMNKIERERERGRERERAVPSNKLSASIC